MTNNIVADASFYICFLNDIDSPESLIRILDQFTAHLSRRLFEEVEKAKNMQTVLETKKDKLNIFTDAPFDLGAVTKPFFSKSEISKGEHEVVVIAYMYYNGGMRFFLIIDELGPRNFVTRNLPYLTDYLRGTVGFIGDCYSQHKIFNKQESLDLLLKIELSKFRVKPEIITATRRRIEGVK